MRTQQGTKCQILHPHRERQNPVSHLMPWEAVHVVTPHTAGVFGFLTLMIPREKLLVPLQWMKVPGSFHSETRPFCSIKRNVSSCVRVFPSLTETDLPMDCQKKQVLLPRLICAPDSPLTTWEYVDCFYIFSMKTTVFLHK